MSKNCWVMYKVENEIKVGLYYTELSYNSLGDIKIEAVNSSPKIIHKEDIIQIIECVNPFIK